VWGRRRQLKPPRHWPPPGGPYRDERLAFLALAPHLKKRDLHAGEWRSLLSAVFGSNYVTAGGREPRLRRHGRRHVAFACQEAAGELDALERQRLRETGELPEWFFVEVERLSRKPKSA
jgi:hypothetical protein